MKRVLRAWRGVSQALITACLCALPSIAYACSACFQAKDEATRVAFLATTLFLTGAPLIMIGGVIYWLASRSVADADAETTSASPEAVPPPAPALPATPATTEPSRLPA